MKCSLLLELVPLVLLVLVISRSEGCGAWEYTGLLPNGYLTAAGLFPGFSFSDVREDTDASIGSSESVRINGTDYMVFDTGLIYRGTSGIHPNIPHDVSAADLTDMFISVFTNPTFSQAKFQVYVLERQALYSSDGTSLGSEACIFETLENRFQRYGYKNVNVTWAAILTFLHSGSSGPAFLNQAALVGDSDGNQFVTIQYDSNMPDFSSILSDASALGAFVNWDDVAYSWSCNSAIDELKTRSNNPCGIAGLYIYKKSDACTDTTVCDNLDPDLNSRSSSCREPVSTKECYASGTCRYLNGSTDSFMFDFTFNKTISGFGGLEVLNDTGHSGGPECVFNVTDDGDSYRVYQLIDSNFINNCGVISDNGAKFTFMVHQYENGSNDILQSGSKMYTITCDPTSLPDDVSLDDVTAGDIVGTVRPNTTDRGFSLSFVNQQGPSNQPFSPNAPVVIGQYIFIEAKFYPDPTNFKVNADPYGLFPTDCWISAEPHLNTNYKVKVLKDGCPYNGRIPLTTGFVANNAIGYQPGDPFCVLSGSFRAARFRQYRRIYAICTFRVCHTAGYLDSFCYDSCDGLGINLYGDFPTQGRRQKRQTSEDEQIVLVTDGLTIIDTEESVDDALGSQSCVDETIAYITISALVIMLFMATVITAMFFMKLQSRKRK